MGAPFNPGDILTISTTSYKGRKFRVAESNSHRTILRGARGARRVLVQAVGINCYSIHDDDGERARAQECTVDEVEGKPGEDSSPTLREPHWPKGWHWSSDKTMAIGPRGRDIESVWVHAKRHRGKPPFIEMPVGCDSAPVSVVESVIQQARSRDPEFGPNPERQVLASSPSPARHYPITAMDLAKLMRCETAREVAEWALERDVSHSCVTRDPHTTDSAAAMKLYLSGLDLQRTSKEAAGA